VLQFWSFRRQKRIRDKKQNIRRKRSLPFLVFLELGKPVFVLGSFGATQVPARTCSGVRGFGFLSA